MHLTSFNGWKYRIASPSFYTSREIQPLKASFWQVCSSRTAIMTFLLRVFCRRKKNARNTNFGMKKNTYWYWSLKLAMELSLFRPKFSTTSSKYCYAYQLWFIHAMMKSWPSKLQLRCQETTCKWEYTSFSEVRSHLKNSENANSILFWLHPRSKFSPFPSHREREIFSGSIWSNIQRIWTVWNIQFPYICLRKLRHWWHECPPVRRRQKKEATWRTQWNVGIDS